MANRFMNLSTDELTRLHSRKFNSAAIAAKVNEAYDFKAAPPAASFDGKAFPLTDCYGDMVRAVHEGVCPVCGCGLKLKNVGKKNPMDQYTMVGTCRNGHKTTTEPSEDGFGDWVAY